MNVVSQQYQDAVNFWNQLLAKSRDKTKLLRLVNKMCDNPRTYYFELWHIYKKMALTYLTLVLHNEVKPFARTNAVILTAEQIQEDSPVPNTVKDYLESMVKKGEVVKDDSSISYRATATLLRHLSESLNSSIANRKKIQMFLIQELSEDPLKNKILLPKVHEDEEDWIQGKQILPTTEVYDFPNGSSNVAEFFNGSFCEFFEDLAKECISLTISSPIVFPPSSEQSFEGHLSSFEYLTDVSKKIEKKFLDHKFLSKLGRYKIKEVQQKTWEQAINEIDTLSDKAQIFLVSSVMKYYHDKNDHDTEKKIFGKLTEGMKEHRKSFLEKNPQFNYRCNNLGY